MKSVDYSIASVHKKSIALKPSVTEGDASSQLGCDFFEDGSFALPGDEPILVRVFGILYWSCELIPNSTAVIPILSKIVQKE